jgi:hypothetical protein
MRALQETFMRSAFVIALFAASTFAASTLSVFAFSVISFSAFFFPAQAAGFGESSWGNFEHDFEANAKAWKEIEAQLPAAPTPKSLIEVKLDSSSRNQLFIDAASLSIGDDGVVRYSAIIRSPSGAETISFEGLRCETGERKLYAFGRSVNNTSGKDTGTWSRNRNAKWEPIQARQAGGYHRELFFHYLCTVNTRRDLPTLLHLLKSGGKYEQ